MYKENSLKKVLTAIGLAAALSVAAVSAYAQTPVPEPLVSAKTNKKSWRPAGA